MGRYQAPRAILFDWDNTLADNWRSIHDALNTTLKAMGHPTWSPDQTRQRVRRSLRDSFPQLFGERWQEARDIFYAEIFANHLSTLRELPGAGAMLADLAGRDLYLGVVSNKRGDLLRREASHLGWDGYFGALVGANDAAEDKPATAPVHLALDGSGIDAGKQVWFVGDTAIDMRCARNSGCVAVLIGDGSLDTEELAQEPPDLHARDFSGLIDLVVAG